MGQYDNVALDGIDKFGGIELETVKPILPRVTGIGGLASNNPSPVPLSGLKVWVAADYGFDAYVDGQVITGATNRGDAGNLIVSAGALGPVWKSGLFGGKACLSFNAGQSIETPMGMVMSSFAVFVVGLISSTTVLQAVYQFSDTIAVSNALFYLNPAIVTLSAIATSSYGIGTTAITRDLRKLWRHRFVDTHASHQLYQNGALLALANDGTAGNPTGVASQAGYLKIGANTPGTVKMIGYVAEILAYSPIPSAADIVTIEQYLTTKWPLE